MGIAARPLAAGVLLSVAATAFAGESPGSIYVVGGLVAAHQAGATGESHQTYKTAPGGTTLGGVASVGVFVTRHLGIEAGFATTGTMTAREPSRYGMTFNEERRDRMLTVATRFHLPQWGAVRVEPVVGVAFTWPHASSQTDRTLSWTTPPQQVVHDPPIEHDLDTGVGVTFGCDVRIGRGRASLLPTFRVTDTGVSGGSYDGIAPRTEIGSIYPGGYPRWTTMAGVALRVDF